MENIPNKLVTINESQAKKIICQPNYKRRTIFADNLVAIDMGKTELVFNKPIYIYM